MTRILWVTNDLPPRPGGIQQFVHNLLIRVHPAETLVLGPDDDRAEEHDPLQPYAVERIGADGIRGLVLPTPAVRRRVARMAVDHRPDVVVLGASWPLGELAGAITRDTGAPVVGISHGLEAGLTSVRLGRLVRRATRDLAALTTISDYTEDRLTPYIEAGRTMRVPPGVDVGLFRPDVDGTGFRAKFGVPQDVPVVGCVSRLVDRKGQDTLLAAWPEIHRAHPDAHLLIVGGGPLEADLRATAAALGPDAGVTITGPIDFADLPAAHAAIDVFAMPCRTRLFGTDVEGLGIVYLEAAATSRPVVAGMSGGAPETVIDGETGLVVDGHGPEGVTAAVIELLDDPAAATAMGIRGREVAEARWSWEAIAERFAVLLDEVVAGYR